MGQRRYHSPLRRQRKDETIRQILDAALRLHRQGITDLPSVAREAGVSLATVTKYFPTREELFQGCTAHYVSLHPLPSPEAWAAISDRQARIGQILSDLFGGYETAFGNLWLAYRLAGESSVMAQMVLAVEQLCHAAAELIVGDWVPAERRSEGVALVAGLLSPLSYRSLRLISRFSPEQSSRWIRHLIDAGLADLGLAN